MMKAPAEAQGKVVHTAPTKTLVIIAPELTPVTKTRFGSALNFSIVHCTMLTMPVLSPPPSCAKVSGEDTSQHLSTVLGLSGKIMMKPY